MGLFLITAPSGAGKTSIVHSLGNAKVWREAISYTTRLPREGEVDGAAYNFISPEKFDELVKDNYFLETAEYDGNLYGVASADVTDLLSKYKNVVVIVEYNGYLQIKEKEPKAVGIFLHMSKEDCLANMLIRGNSVDKALKRISTYDNEVKNKGEFDYVVKNIRNKQRYTEKVIMSILEQNH